MPNFFCVHHLVILIDHWNFILKKSSDWHSILFASGCLALLWGSILVRHLLATLASVGSREDSWGGEVDPETFVAWSTTDLPHITIRVK